MRSSISIIARTILLRPMPCTARHDLIRRKQWSPSFRWILFGDTILYLHQPICITIRRDWTLLRDSHDKEPSSCMQLTNVMSYQVHFTFRGRYSRSVTKCFLHPQTAADHACCVGKMLHTPVGSVFGDNVRQHDWEAFAQSLCKKRNPCSPRKTYPRYHKITTPS